jgi:hypothetical protein
MGHPIIDGLLIGAAAGAGANLAHQAMQPGQTPIWTGTFPDGTILTVVSTRRNRFEMWAIFSMPPDLAAGVAKEIESGGGSLDASTRTVLDATLSGSKNIRLGSYPNWVTLMTGVQGWADYFKNPADVRELILWWMLRNVEIQRRAEIAAPVPAAEPSAPTGRVGRWLKDTRR